MKVTSVELVPANSSLSCILSFRDPGRTNPFNVKNIVGLDADEIIPRSYGTPGVSNFNEMSMVKRTIALRIQLNPRYNLSETPASLRDKLMKLIASSRTGTLGVYFKDEAVTVATVSGYVVKFESALTNQDPEVQLTIKCDEPMLKSPTETVISVVGLDPSLTIINDVLSTAPHGFTFQMRVDVATASLVIADPNDAGWNFTVSPVGGFLVNDVIHFSSAWNNKYLYVVQGGTTIYLADVIVAGSVWPILFPGENRLTVTNGPNFDWVAVSYYPTYWGV